MRERMERLDKFMNVKQLNDNQVTIMCGLSIGLLNKARAGKSDIGMAACNKILSKYPELSRVWLLTGEGEMLKSSQVSDNVVPCGDSSASTKSVAPDELMLENERLKAKIASLEELDEQMSTLFNKLDKMREEFFWIIIIGFLCVIATLFMMIPLIMGCVEEALQ